MTFEERVRDTLGKLLFENLRLAALLDDTLKSKSSDMESDPESIKD